MMRSCEPSPWREVHPLNSRRIRGWWRLTNNRTARRSPLSKKLDRRAFLSSGRLFDRSLSLCPAFVRFSNFVTIMSRMSATKQALACDESRGLMEAFAEAVAELHRMETVQV